MASAHTIFLLVEISTALIESAFRHLQVKIYGELKSCIEQRGTIKYSLRTSLDIIEYGNPVIGDVITQTYVIPSRPHFLTNMREFPTQFAEVIKTVETKCQRFLMQKCVRSLGGAYIRVIRGVEVHVWAEEDGKKAKTGKIMKEQFDVVGCPNLYKIVDENLKRGLIEFSLLKESLDLHQWRKRYVRQNMLLLTLADENPETLKFEHVVDICSSSTLGRWLGKGGLHKSEQQNSTVSKDESKRRVRMDRLQELFRCGPKSDVAWLWKHHFLTPEYLADSNLSYGDVARILFQHYGNSPFKLEELAMRTVKKEGRIALESIYNEPVKMNDKDGFFILANYESDLKKFSEVGQEHLEQLKKVYDEMRHNAERKVRCVQDLPKPDCVFGPGYAYVHLRAATIITNNVYEAFRDEGFARCLRCKLNFYIENRGPTKYALSVNIKFQNAETHHNHLVQRPPLVIRNMDTEFAVQFEEAMDDLQTLCQCYINIEKTKGFHVDSIEQVVYTIYDWYCDL